MDIILLHSVEKLGERGQKVSVAPGYARNYLFPQGLAIHADTAHLRELDTKLQALDRRDERERKAAQEGAERMREVSVKITAAASDEDKLYGSVTSQMIASALAEKGYAISARQVELEESLKKLGTYTVPIRLHGDVRVEIQVWIERA